MPLLLVDSGGLFADDRTTHDFMRVDVVAKNDHVMQAYNHYGVDAINLSATDWRYLARLLERNEFVTKSQSLPVFKRIVSANVTSAAPAFKPAPYLVREVPLPGSSTPVRVAFIGLTELGVNLPSIFKISDPVAAARRVIPEARRNADLVIILSHLKVNEALQLAREAQGVNLIINGTGDTVNMFTPPMKLGDMLIEFTPYETRFVGEVRFFKDAQGRFTLRDRYISLDENLKDDAAAAEIARAATRAKDDAYREAQQLLKDWQATANAAVSSTPAKSAEGVATATYISAQACASCHAEQYLKWVNTRHARTSDNLVLKKYEFDSSCLQCHGSIRQKAGELPKFASVQCEQCHGPGSLHAAKPAKGYGKVTNLPSTCLSCHTPEINPKFDLQSAWQKIKH